MAFDFTKHETDRQITYKELEYRVITECDSGLLLVAKESDVINKSYPLQLFAIPNIDDAIDEE